ncbi:MAG: DUF4275 family protein [Clostridia bacterium]|nr:DUF4275 family protein [Clostridia bacterium]
MLTEQKIINNWLYAFARDVDKAFLETYVTSECNYLWHIFSFEQADCLKDDEARREFDRIAYDKAIRFRDGFGGQITAVTETGKISAASLDRLRGQDVYIVAEDFSWTYVKTHENGWCGPYFCYRRPEKWELK